MDAAVSSTRVVIADDHPLMLAATSQVFDDAKGFEVVGKATTGHQVEPSSRGRDRTSSFSTSSFRASTAWRA
jgi:hypothetical protein